MFKLIKRIKKLEEQVKMLVFRVEQLEEKYNKLWEESHPATMGGK